MKKLEWYREYKEEERKKLARNRAVRNEIFSEKAEKLSTNIVRISNGDIYKIMPRFGTRYEKSTIIKLDPKEVGHHIKEDQEIKELAKIMASK